MSLSIVDHWPGSASIDALAARAEVELRSTVQGPVSTGPLGTGMVDRVRAEGDDIKVGVAMASLAAEIDRRIAAHPEVPHDTATSLAAALRDRGAALSFGAAREATADHNTFTFRRACLPSADALVAAVWREQANPSGPVLREFTPEMAQRDRVAAMDCAVLGQDNPVGMSWGQTAYLYARGNGAGPDQLERAYAAGTVGDSLLGTAGSFAAAGAARDGVALLGAQTGLLRKADRVPAPTEPAQSVLVNGGIRSSGETRLTAADFPSVSRQISQKRLRHVAGRPEYRAGGFLDSTADAQAVLDALHAGSADILGKTARGGYPVMHVAEVTGTNVNVGAGYPEQPTNIFKIKGTANLSVVPTNPAWRP